METPGPPDEVDGCQTSGGVIYDSLVEGEVFASWGFKDALPKRVDLQLVRRYLPINLMLPQAYFHWPEALELFAFPILDLRKVLEGGLLAAETVLYIFEPTLRRGDAPRPALAAAIDKGWI